MSLQHRVVTLAIFELAGAVVACAERRYLDAAIGMWWADLLTKLAMPRAQLALPPAA